MTRHTGPTLGPGQALIATVTGGIAALVASVAATIGTLVLLGGSLDGRMAESLPVVSAGIVTTSAVLALTAVLAARAARAPIGETLGLQGAPGAAFLAAPVGVVALSPLSDTLVRFVARTWPELTFGQLEGLRAIAEAHPPWVLVPLLAVLPGLSEELLFRGMLQRAFGSGGAAIVVSAGAFALFHADPRHVAGVLPLGLYLAWVAARTDSTWVPVVAHVANNATAVGMPHVPALDVGYGTGHPMPAWWTPVGLAVAMATAVVIVRATRRSASNAG